MGMFSEGMTPLQFHGAILGKAREYAPDVFEGPDPMRGELDAVGVFSIARGYMIAIVGAMALIIGSRGCAELLYGMADEYAGRDPNDFPKPLVKWKSKLARRPGR